MALRVESPLQVDVDSVDVASELENFLEVSPELLCITNAQGTWLRVSRAFAERLGYPEDQLIGKRTSDFVHPDDLERTMLARQHVLAGKGTFDFEHRFRCADGNYLLLTWRASALKDGKFYAMAQEVTEVRRLRRLHEQTQAIAKIGGWELESSGERFWTEELYRLHDLDPSGPMPSAQEAIGFFDEESRQVIIPAIAACREQGTPFDIEIDLTSATGRKVRARGVGRGHFVGGKVDRIYGAFMDITDQKRTEEALRASLAEKEVLLREVHHRVKNNMQIISSLLSLEAGRAQDPALKSVLLTAQNRVRAMAAVHERLYRSTDLSQVELGGYLQDLVSELRRASSRPGITIDVDAVGISLAVDVAIPCGLIVNELVSNALEHAFPDERKGHVAVQIVADGKDLVLRVADDGIGASEKAPEGSIGLRLVERLARQLKARLVINRSPGTTVEVRFPAPETT